jgi:hypothetical protein
MAFRGVTFLSLELHGVSRQGWSTRARRSIIGSVDGVKDFDEVRRYYS